MAWLFQCCPVARHDTAGSLAWLEARRAAASEPALLWVSSTEAVFCSPLRHSDGTAQGWSRRSSAAVPPATLADDSATATPRSPSLRVETVDDVFHPGATLAETPTMHEGKEEHPRVKQEAPGAFPPLAATRLDPPSFIRRGQRIAVVSSVTTLHDAIGFHHTASVDGGVRASSIHTPLCGVLSDGLCRMTDNTVRPGAVQQCLARIADLPVALRGSITSIDLVRTHHARSSNDLSPGFHEGSLWVALKEYNKLEQADLTAVSEWLLRDGSPFLQQLSESDGVVAVWELLSAFILHRHNEHDEQATVAVPEPQYAAIINAVTSATDHQRRTALRRVVHAAVHLYLNRGVCLWSSLEDRGTVLSWTTAAPIEGTASSITAGSVRTTAAEMIDEALIDHLQDLSPALRAVLKHVPALVSSSTNASQVQPGGALSQSANRAIGSSLGLSMGHGGVVGTAAAPPLQRTPGTMTIFADVEAFVSSNSAVGSHQSDSSANGDVFCFSARRARTLFKDEGIRQLTFHDAVRRRQSVVSATAAVLSRGIIAALQARRSARLCWKLKHRRASVACVVLQQHLRCRTASLVVSDRLFTQHCDVMRHQQSRTLSVSEGAVPPFAIHNAWDEDPPPPPQETTHFFDPTEDFGPNEHWQRHGGHGDGYEARGEESGPERLLPAFTSPYQTLKGRRTEQRPTQPLCNVDLSAYAYKPPRYGDGWSPAPGSSRRPSVFLPGGLSAAMAETEQAELEERSRVVADERAVRHRILRAVDPLPVLLRQEADGRLRLGRELQHAVLELFVSRAFGAVGAVRRMEADSRHRIVRSQHKGLGAWLSVLERQRREVIVGLESDYRAVFTSSGGIGAVLADLSSVLEAETRLDVGTFHGPVFGGELSSHTELSGRAGHVFGHHHSSQSQSSRPAHGLEYRQLPAEVRQRYEQQHRMLSSNRVAAMSRVLDGVRQTLRDEHQARVLLAGVARQQQLLSREATARRLQCEAFLMERWRALWSWSRRLLPEAELQGRRALFAEATVTLAEILRRAAIASAEIRHRPDFGGVVGRPLRGGRHGGHEDPRAMLRALQEEQTALRSVLRSLRDADQRQRTAQGTVVDGVML